MAEVKFSRAKTLDKALTGDPNTVYFTTDTKDIVMGGDTYNVRRVFWTSLEITQQEDDSFVIEVTGVDDIKDPGEYRCYTGTPAEINTEKFLLTVTYLGTDFTQTIHSLVDIDGLNRSSDYIIRTGSVSNNGTVYNEWKIVRKDCEIYWEK